MDPRLTARHFGMGKTVKAFWESMAKDQRRYLHRFLAGVLICHADYRNMAFADAAALGMLLQFGHRTFY
jgi:hypothetical protein